MPNLSERIRRLRRASNPPVQDGSPEHRHVVYDIAIDDLENHWDFVCVCICGRHLTRNEINADAIWDPSTGETVLQYFDKVHTRWAKGRKEMPR